MTDSTFEKALSDIIASAKDGRLQTAVVSKFPKGKIQKVRIASKDISGKRVLQFEYFLTEGRLCHENADERRSEEILRELVATGAKQIDVNCADLTGIFMVSKKGKVSYVRRKKATESESLGCGTNDRKKDHVFSGCKKFLIELGISDKNGRVHDKRQSKFRQINRFCESVGDIVKYLPRNREVNIADLCCGKSYLSFAVYDYLTRIIGMKVNMVCVDLKKSVIDFCAATAEKLGFFGMHFICDDIWRFNPPKDLDLVISLHACDTATDAVLDFAVTHGAKVVLSTPCCQHEMFSLMDQKELDFIAKHSILKQKFCSVATDALRCARLEACGYKVAAVELIDPDETPKNVLIRAVLRRPGIDTAKAVYYAEKYRYMTGKEPSPLPKLGNEENFENDD